MLIEFLPTWLIKQIKKQPLNQQNPQVNQLPQVKPPQLNLLYGIDTGHHHLFKVPSSTKFFVFGLQFVFMFLLIWNWYTNVSISRMLNDTSALNYQVAKFAEIEIDLTNIIRKTQYYKNQRSQRQTVGSKMERFFAQIPPQIFVNRLSFESSKADVTAIAQSPLDFSIFIANLFKNDLVKQVTLRGAHLDSNTRNFTIEMEVDLK